MEFFKRTLSEQIRTAQLELLKYKIFSTTIRDREIFILRPAKYQLLTISSLLHLRGAITHLANKYRGRFEILKQDNQKIIKLLNNYLIISYQSCDIEIQVLANINEPIIFGKEQDKEIIRRIIENDAKTLDLTENSIKLIEEETYQKYEVQGLKERYLMQNNKRVMDINEDLLIDRRILSHYKNIFQEIIQAEIESQHKEQFLRKQPNNMIIKEEEKQQYEELPKVKIEEEEESS